MSTGESKVVALRIDHGASTSAKARHEHGEVHEPLAPGQRAAGDEREAEQREEQQRLAAGQRRQGDERAEHRHPPHGARVEVGVGRQQHGDDERRRRATRS